MSDVNVKFSVSGNDLLSFIEKMKQKSSEMVNDMIKGSRDQIASSKELLDTVAEQIKALEKKRRLEFEMQQVALKQQRDLRIDERIADTAAQRESINQAHKEGRISSVERRRQLMDLPGSFQISQEEEDAYREQLRLAREAYRENQTQTRLAREQVEEVRRTSKAQLRQMQQGDESIVNAVEEGADEQERLANEVASETYTESKDKEKKRESEESVLKSLYLFDLLQKGAGAARSMMGSQTGFDALGGVGDLVSAAGGGIASTLIEGLSEIFLDEDNPLQRYVKKLSPMVGKAVESGIGMEFDAMQRSFDVREELFKVINHTGGLTGKSINPFDLSQYGYSYTDVAQAQQQVIQARGTTAGADVNAEALLMYQRSSIVDSSILLQLMELQRSNQEGNRDVNKTVQGILGGEYFQTKGERTMLPIFLSNMMQLQREFLKGSENVKESTTSSILEMFDKVGGQFKIEDPRSIGNISAIQSGLTNPSSDNLKALSYIALSKMNPNAGIADILEMQEGGMSTPDYLQAMMQYAVGQGGDSNFQRMQLKGMFPGLSMAAVRRMYENKDAILEGKASYEDFAASDLSMVRENAAGSTTSKDIFTAEIKNSFVLGTAQGMSEVADKIAEAVKIGFQNVQVEIVNSDVSGRTRATIKVNQTKRPGQ